MEEGFTPGSDRKKVATLRGILYSVLFAIQDGDLNELELLFPEIQNILYETSDEGSEKPLSLLGAIMHCPNCSKRHIDEGEFATRMHHTHRCVNDAAGVGCG